MFACHFLFQIFSSVLLPFHHSSIILPYVGQERFVYIIDSWGGQTDLTLYDHMFVDERKACTCTVKIIPFKCTPHCQPCDVYFYRQVLIVIKKLQNVPDLLKTNREIASGKDAIKIHSLILHQLSSPDFSDMIKCACFALKLIEERTIFMNLNEMFPDFAPKKSVHLQNSSLYKMCLVPSKFVFRLLLR